MHAEISVDAPLQQAFWRIANNGNPHFVRYYSANKKRGLNDKQVSWGRVTRDGRDLTDKAGKIYFYDPVTVEQHQLGFGVWSRSDQGSESTCRFLAWDIEPITRVGSKRVNHAPTTAHRKETLVDATSVYRAVDRLARQDRRIVWTLLVQTSLDHYHMWALLESPVSRAEHRELLGAVNASAGPLANLDKDSGTQDEGLGGHFRAPWTFKRNQRSFALLSNQYRDNATLIQLGVEAKPRPPVVAAVPTDARDLEAQLKYLIQRFPIEAAGCRNAVQGRLVASLVSRGFSESDALQVGSHWLDHFQPIFTTDLLTAKRYLRQEISRTIRNPRFAQRESPINYRQVYQEAVLTPVQVDLLQGQLVNGSLLPCPSPACHSLPVSRLSLPDQEEDDTGLGESDTSPSSTSRRQEGGGLGEQLEENDRGVAGDRVHLHQDQLGEGDISRGPQGQVQLGEIDTRGRSSEHSPVPPQLGESDTISSLPGAEPLCRTTQERWFVEALILQGQQKLKENLGGDISMTHAQVIEIIQLRHGLSLDPQQFQRLKRKYVTFRAAGGDNRWHQASRYELLRETSKGSKPARQPSTYQVTGLHEVLVGPAAENRECEVAAA